MEHLEQNVRVAVELDNPSIRRIEEKCIKCGLCASVCNDFASVNSHYSLQKCGHGICVNCGQCVKVCPVASLVGKDEFRQVENLMRKDKSKIFVVSTSPSVRIGLGDEFGLAAGAFVQGKMISLLRKLGFTYVLDTNFAADLTICEEATEFVKRFKANHAENECKNNADAVQNGLKNKSFAAENICKTKTCAKNAEKSNACTAKIANENQSFTSKKSEKAENIPPLPQFTSCCPAWVKFVEYFYPQLLPNLSSCKSPIGMQGSVIKTYFAQKMGVDPSRIVNVALTPCVAKKAEIRRKEMNVCAKVNKMPALRDMDYVITTVELAKWAKEKGLDLNALPDGTYDNFLGQASGAGVIFGNSGGVMEAALRTSYTYLTGKQPPEKLLNLQCVRGLEGIKEGAVDIDGTAVKVAAVFGLNNARKLLQRIQNGEHFDFVEVMACPGGCIGGGGQPKHIGQEEEFQQKRIETLYKRDQTLHCRAAHQNEEVAQLYKEYLGKPGSKMAEILLHTKYTNRSADLGEDGNGANT